MPPDGGLGYNPELSKLGKDFKIEKKVELDETDEELVREFLQLHFSKGFTAEQIVEIGANIRALLEVSPDYSHPHIESLLHQSVYNNPNLPDGGVRVLTERIGLIYQEPSEIQEIWHDVLNHMKNNSTRMLFLKKFSSFPPEVSRQFFANHAERWKTQEGRLRVLEEYFLDTQKLQQIAVEQLIKKAKQEGEDLSDLSTDEPIEVELKVPTIQYSPVWYQDPSLAGSKHQRFNRTDDEDDNDFAVEYDLRVYHETPKTIKKSDARKIANYLTDSKYVGEDFDLEAVLESAYGIGPIPPEKMEEMRRVLDSVRTIWSGKAANVRGLRALQEKREDMLRLRTLPRAAEAFSFEHNKLGKISYPSFESKLKRRMAELILTLTLDRARKGEVNVTEINELLIKVEERARRIYKEVVERSTPVFKDFVKWLDQEQKKGGEDYAGEFYVGRDTYATMYQAAKAFRFGKKAVGKTRAVNVYVNVSRPLIDNMQMTAETREMMKTWLEQAGVTREMFGVDGGYSGSSPLGVFAALEKATTYGERLDSEIEHKSKVRLVESSSFRQRLFNPNGNYKNFVSWMETLPKFTERAQVLVEAKHGKYIVEDKKRSSVEQVLAWTVQRAVWREFAGHHTTPLAGFKSETDMGKLEELQASLDSGKWSDDWDESKETAVHASGMPKGKKTVDEVWNDLWDEPVESKKVEEKEAKSFWFNGQYVELDAKLSQANDYGERIHELTLFHHEDGTSTKASFDLSGVSDIDLLVKRVGKRVDVWGPVSKSQLTEIVEQEIEKRAPKVEKKDGLKSKYHYAGGKMDLTALRSKISGKYGFKMDWKGGVSILKHMIFQDLMMLVRSLFVLEKCLITKLWVMVLVCFSFNLW